MAFDFKKEYKAFYLPADRPALISVSTANYLAVRGSGDPNEEGGAYKTAVGALYAVAYTIKMSKLGDRRIAGYYDFVVPPLEGFWRQPGVAGFDPGRKALLQWISVIRLPDFVTGEDVAWAAAEAARKKKLNCAAVEFLTVDEGLCVQILHIGPYDAEAASVAKMDAYLRENGYVNDLSGDRLHHEIYLSDARKVAPEKWRTVIRHPVRKV